METGNEIMSITSIAGKFTIKIFCLLAFLTFIAIQADAQVTITAGNASGSPNDTVPVTFSLNGTPANGLANFEFRVTYDNTRVVPVDSTVGTPGALGSGGVTLGPALPPGTLGGDDPPSGQIPNFII